MPPRSLAFRLVVGAAVWCVAALALGGWALSMVFQDAVGRSFDARLSVLLEGVVAATEVAEDGTLALVRPLGEARFDRPLSGWYWQIDTDDGPPIRSRSLWDQALDVDRSALAAESPAEPLWSQRQGPDRQVLRVVARTIQLPEVERPLVYTVAGDMSEVRAEVRRFNATLAWALAALLVGLIVAVFVQVRFGLQPLRRLGRALADIREGRAERLEGPFPAEVEPLAVELNALVAYGRELIGRARTHVGNLAHALKTPLSVLANEAAAPDGPSPDSVARQVTAMRRHVDHHLVRARAAGAAGVLVARAPVAPAVADLTRTLARIHADRRLDFDVHCPPSAVFLGERQDLEEMIGNLLDNACKWAVSTVRLVVRVAEGRMTLRVEDDGPGLPDGAIERALARGGRLDESVPGSGLGLPIVRDVAGLYGGVLTLENGVSGGLIATLDLPAAPA